MKKTLLYCILLTIGLTGCKSKDVQALDWQPNEKIRDQIAEIVQDTDRQQAMLGIMDAFNAEMKGIADDVKAQRAKIVKANADYDTSRADLEKMYGELNAKVGQIGDVARKHSFELRTHCSEAEWKKIFAHTKGNKIKYL